MEFNVKLDRYEGPYTKLLELIEQKKLSITEISLVDVADDYIAYVKSIGGNTLIDISQFIVVASTLILMKAKSLLPGVVYTEDEEKQVSNLEYKLALYALLMNASKKISSIYNKTPLFNKERISYKGVTVFVPDSRVNGIMLQSIAELTLRSFVTPKQLVKVAVEQALRIENVIEKMLDRVRNIKSLTLESLADGINTLEERKKVLIVNFIALLELIRVGSLSAEQDSGGEIKIQTLDIKH